MQFFKKYDTIIARRNLHGRAKPDKTQIPHLHRRSGPDRGHSHARAGKAGHRGPLAGGPGDQGGGAEAGAGQVPHPGPAHYPGRGDLFGFHDQYETLFDDAAESWIGIEKVFNLPTVDLKDE
mgnify:CR=1 FL=1